MGVDRATACSITAAMRPFVATFFVFSDYMRPAVRLAALNEHAGDLRVDARLGRPRRGRPDAPAGRAPDGAARDAEPRACSALPTPTRRPPAGASRCTRTHGPDGPRAVAPGSADARRSRGRARRRARRLRARRRQRRDPDRDRLRGLGRARRARRAREAEHLARASSRCRAGSCSREQDAGVPRRRCCRRERWQRVSVEAGVTFGWREYVGDRGIAIGVDRFGASAPGEVLIEKLGITPAHVAAAAKRVLATK